MELQHKQIEAIADNVQTVLNNELQSISKYKELENKFNNLQNAIFNPFTRLSSFLGADEFLLIMS